MTETSRIAGHSLKSWCVIAGVALVVQGLAYALMVGAGMQVNVAPANSVQYLDALAAHASAAKFEYLVTAAADLAFVPAAIALYLLLKNVSKILVTVATVLILAYVVIDMSTFVPAALSLAYLSQSAQTASVVSSEHAALSVVPLSQFFGWVEPPVAFAMYILVLRKANLGRFARIFGIFLVMFSIMGGLGFLFPSSTYLANFEVPAFAAYVLFFLGFGEAILRARGEGGVIQRLARSQ